MRSPRQAAQRVSLSQRRRLAGAVSAISRHSEVGPCSVTESIGRQIVGDVGTFVFDRHVWGGGSTVYSGRVMLVKQSVVSRAPGWLYLKTNGTMSARDAFWSEERPSTATLPMTSADSRSY